jgi:hypothetical protein
MKRLAIGLLGSAADAYGEGLKDAQEVLAHVADVVIEVYAVESLLARAEKTRGDEAAAVAVDIARVYATDAAGRAAHAARQVIAALGQRATKLQPEAVYSMLSHPPIDTIAARRRIADAVIGGGFRMVLG